MTDNKNIKKAFLKSILHFSIFFLLLLGVFTFLYFFNLLITPQNRLEKGILFFIFDFLIIFAVIMAIIGILWIRVYSPKVLKSRNIIQYRQKIKNKLSIIQKLAVLCMIMGMIGMFIVAILIAFNIFLSSVIMLLFLHMLFGGGITLYFIFIFGDILDE